MPGSTTAPLKIAIIGAGWAGLAAAVSATQAGHFSTVFEASNSIGGRARALNYSLPNGTPVTLDNGQHILIGAYTETLRLMRLVGLNPQYLLFDVPMTLQFPDGLGIRFPNWPTPLDALGGILGARGWAWPDKWSLLRTAARWQLQGFKCVATLSVAELCQPLTQRVYAELIEPLCISALNTPPKQASASVFLRVLRDALFGVAGGSHLLLPQTDLGALFPDAAARWLEQHGAHLRLSSRVREITQNGSAWRVDGECFDAVILATSADHAVQILLASRPAASPELATKIQVWVNSTSALRFEAIATVYAWANTAALSQPMLALRSSVSAPAQFVFDRGQLGGTKGLLAFVVSTSQGERATLQAQVLQQAKTQLDLDLQVVQTVVEKRATFACTPNLVRPKTLIAPGLLACGDYVSGPYPATLEGALRSAIAAIDAISLSLYDHAMRQAPFTPML